MLRILLILPLTWVAYLSSAQVLLPTDSLIKRLAKHPQPDTGRVLLLNQLAFSNYYSNPLQSLKYGFASRQLADSLHFTRGEADAFRQIGLAFWAQADMTTAINYYLTGLHMAQTNKHKQVEADIIGNIGTAYNGMGNPEEALKFLLRSRQLQQELKNEWREAAVLNNIGDSYRALNDFVKSKQAYISALEYARRNNYDLGVATNLRNLGNILELEKKYDSALGNYSDALALSLSINDSRGIILCYSSMASVFFKAGQFAKAKEFINKSLQAARKVKLRAFIRDAYELLVKISEAEGNKIQAYEYFKLFNTYRDSVQNLRIVSDIAAARLRFETDKKQFEIESLKGEKELQDAEIKYQNTQIFIISLSLLLSLIFMTLAFVSYGKVRERNKQLMQSKQEIEMKNKLLSQQGDEMAALNEELRAQQDQVTAQRDELMEKNEAIKLMNNEVTKTNQNLENLVSVRTKVLLDQNKRLSDYSYFNAHQLRSPVASIMGLVKLLQHQSTREEHLQLLVHLETSVQKLDEAIRSINDTLQAGIDPGEKKPE